MAAKKSLTTVNHGVWMVPVNQMAPQINWKLKKQEKEKKVRRRRFKSAAERYFEKKCKELEDGTMTDEQFVEVTGICKDAVSRRLWKKKWINASRGTQAKNRVWKNCKFVGEELFFTRMTGKKKESTIYHICANEAKFIVYAVVDKSSNRDPQCSMCETKIPKGMAMASRLKKLDV